MKRTFGGADRPGAAARASPATASRSKAAAAHRQTGRFMGKERDETAPGETCNGGASLIPLTPSPGRPGQTGTEGLRAKLGGGARTAPGREGE